MDRKDKWVKGRGMGHGSPCHSEKTHRSLAECYTMLKSCTTLNYLGRQETCIHSRCTQQEMPLSRGLGTCLRGEHKDVSSF